MAEEKTETTEETKEDTQEETKEEKPATEETTEEEVKDKHGQPGINKERHEKEMAAKDAKIKELEEKLDEKAKTEEGRGEIKGEIEKLKEEMADERLSHKLELAGCRNVKAAKALLEDYDNDVEKLKAAEPYLFASEKKKGSTGFKPEGATSDVDARRAKAREVAGLPPKKE